ncbi:hypothetical protein INT48_007272 [Thamnidium elegans]|uniref:Uncharacterized protein n=1 Tax=Thamnidium elegans TaxID=101142 RepID=A0A8H7VNF1_9FUNG|nr:hypothetical protein INT48_007272 [Thamnidium elegans]
MLYNTINQSNSTKWKKRLINLSHKLHLSNNHNNHWNASSSSATAMAAATEKFIRHSTPATSEILIHSEDLTASQFANLTGIKTKRASFYTSTPEENAHDFYTASLSSSSHHKHQPAMKIWDSHFWKNDKNLASSASLKDISSTEKIISSQPLSRHTSEPGGQRVPSMIQKGRFKIVWGGDDNEPITPIAPQCVEWKRKRASSASTAI